MVSLFVFDDDDDETNDTMAIKRNLEKKREKTAELDHKYLNSKV